MSHDIIQRLDEIEEKLCRDPCFSSEEKELIREMLRLLRGWRFFAKVIRGSTVVIGALVAFIAAIKSLVGEVGSIWPF